MGAKKRPFYRLVVANSTDARDGRFIESIGYYDPCTEPPAVKVNAEKVAYWLKCGAQPSDTARALLQKQGLIGGAAAAVVPAADEAPAESPAEVKKSRSSRKPAETPQAAE
jgi:small subunit ribosomal protein S16